MNDLIQARRSAEAAANAVNRALLDVRDLVPKVPRVCPFTGTQHSNECDQWQNVYYSDGALNPKKWAAFQKAAPEAAAKVQELVCAAVEARDAYKALRNAPKAPRVRRATGRYSVPPALPVAVYDRERPAAIGSILLLQFGNGTQLFIVERFSPKGTSYIGRRLFNRGTQHAAWVASAIGVRDSRIRCYTSLVPGDPKP